MLSTIDTSSINLSVVTATYNERKNISLLIEELNRIFSENNIRGQVVVVDDSSPDGTSERVVELQEKYPLTKLVKRPGKLGIATAYRDGLNAAEGGIVAFMDADFSMPPSIIPQLYNIALENKIGWGSRYLGKVKFETDIPHLIGTTFLNRWISFWLNTKIKDHTLGYICIKKELIKQIIDFGAEKDIHPFDNVLYGLPLSALAKKNGHTIVEVDSPYEKRKHGVSKIDFVDGLKLVCKDMLYTLRLHQRLKR